MSGNFVCLSLFPLRLTLAEELINVSMTARLYIDFVLWVFFFLMFKKSHGNTQWWKRFWVWVIILSGVSSGDVVPVPDITVRDIFNQEAAHQQHLKTGCTFRKISLSCLGEANQISSLPAKPVGNSATLLIGCKLIKISGKSIVTHKLVFLMTTSPTWQ